MATEAGIGAVVIGRNEGIRLEICLLSLIGRATPVVYVDSGSSDGSVDLALRLGADVIKLDRVQQFTAARARNAGFRRMVEIAGAADHVQFVDGDCELQPDWLATASAFLRDQPDVAVACGRVRERFPHASPYNRLCDMEWNAPTGEVKACGGIAMMRVDAFIEIGGFAEEMIAGEEPDLCFRLRRAGWRILRLNDEMALHDAAMIHVGQWWQRARRSGYADMEANLRRGRQEAGLGRKVWSNAFWALPLAWPLWPLLWWRIYRREGALYATHIVAGKLPHLQGQIDFVLRRWRRKRESRP